MKTENGLEIAVLGKFPDCVGKTCFKWEYEIVEIIGGLFTAEISVIGSPNARVRYNGDLQDGGQSGFKKTLWRVLDAWFQEGVTAAFVSGSSGCPGDCVCGGYGEFLPWHEGQTTHNHRQSGIFRYGPNLYRVDAIVSGLVDYKRRQANGVCNPTESSSTSTAAVVVDIDTPPDIPA